MKDVKENNIPGRSSTAKNLKILLLNAEVLSSRDLLRDLSGPLMFMKIHFFFVLRLLERNSLEFILP